MYIFLKFVILMWFLITTVGTFILYGSLAHYILSCFSLFASNYSIFYELTKNYSFYTISLLAEFLAGPCFYLFGFYFLSLHHFLFCCCFSFSGSRSIMSKILFGSVHTFFSAVIFASPLHWFFILLFLVFFWPYFFLTGVWNRSVVPTCLVRVMCLPPSPDSS